MSILSPWGYHISQTVKYDDEPRHMVYVHKHVNSFEYVVLRCGEERWAYYGTYGSCSWSTQDAPDCSDCLDWLMAYMKQPPLPFPNGYDKNGCWGHIPEIARPVPNWIEKIPKNL